MPAFTQGFKKYFERNKMSKYRDEHAKKHQEVVTPPELVEHIYSYLTDDDLKGDILDPCVGPGALIQPLLENPKYTSLTVLDIQSTHINKYKEK
jgi:type I restriction-modification system DNA methylase subunit